MSHLRVHVNVCKHKETDGRLKEQFINIINNMMNEINENCNLKNEITSEQVFSRARRAEAQSCQ